VSQSCAGFFSADFVAQPVWDRAIEPPAAACRGADSLRTEHHAQLKEILRAVGCCDGREEANAARNNVPPLPAALDGTECSILNRPTTTMCDSF
jgi:hypothetical protein